MITTTQRHFIDELLDDVVTRNQFITLSIHPTTHVVTITRTSSTGTIDRTFAPNVPARVWAVVANDAFTQAIYHAKNAHATRRLADDATRVASTMNVASSLDDDDAYCTRCNHHREEHDNDDACLVTAEPDAPTDCLCPAFVD